MTNKLTNAYPQESDSQRIGQLASRCFQANMPLSWRCTDLSGDNDYGYDYQVQLATAGLVKDSFRVQLKGTTAPSLNANNTKYSIPLELSTVNYYLRATEPILLVLCDLSVDIEHPKNCKLYFQWIHDDLRRICESGVSNEQKTATFHVPVANCLDEAADLSSDIARFRQMAKIGEQLDLIIEHDQPSLSANERTELAAKLTPSLEKRSPALINALADDPTTSWVDAPINTLHWHLQAAVTALHSGNIGEASQAVGTAELFLAGTKPLEQADYWHVKGRLQSFKLDDIGACDAFEKACGLSNDAPRNLLLWAESEIRRRFLVDGTNNFSNVIARLSGTGAATVSMRAKAIAAEGRYPEAIAVAESINGIEGLIAKAIIFAMLGRQADVINSCDAGLTESTTLDTKHARQIFLILRARAHFVAAITNSASDKLREPHISVPVTGPPSTNPVLLKKAWDDIAEAITLLRASGWPANVEFLSDVWSATASMLGIQKKALPLMAEAGAARPSLLALQAEVESLATQTANYSLAIEANLRQEDDNACTVRRISHLHHAGRHTHCFELMSARVADLSDETPMFGYAVIFAILSADRLIQPAFAAQWVQLLESGSKHAPYLALLRYSRTMSKNSLMKDSAIAELDRQYEILGQPSVITLQLFHDLDTTNEQQAERSLVLADKLQSTQLLNIKGALHLAQALATLRRWNDLLTLSDQALQRFEGNDRLFAVGALALDKLGRTGEAHARLQTLMEKSDTDELALNTYIAICSRSGFTKEAVACLERVLAAEPKQSKQIDCLKHIFQLIHLTDPFDPRLVEFAVAIGERVNADSEIEEGLYLMTMFEATLPADATLAEDRKTEFQQRLTAFIERYPNSKILKRISLPSVDQSTDIMRLLQELTGIDDEQLRLRKKAQNELSRGVAAIPYAWRPKHVLEGIPDLLTLWEIGKRSKWNDYSFHLTMVHAYWQPVPLRSMRGRLPLLDLTSLLVIGDLELFDALFQLFPKIAIGKATILILQQLLSPLSGCPFRERCLHLQNSLKARFHLIEQPSVEVTDEKWLRGLGWSSGEVLELAKTDDFLLFVDDCQFRMFATSLTNNSLSICTLDLLLALDEANILKPEEVAKYIATLCSWRVSLVVPTRYQIAILPKTLGEARNLSVGIEILRADFLCNTLFSCVWDLKKPYSELHENASALISILIADPKNNIESIAALAGFWLGKVKFHKQAPMPITHTIAYFIIRIIVFCKKRNEETSRRVWSIYHDLIAEEFGDRMDDDKYRNATRTLGKIAAEIDTEMALKNNLSTNNVLNQGLTSGTSDAGLFNTGYNNSLIEVKRQT